MLLSRELLLRDVIADGLLAAGSGFITLLSCFDPEGSVINACRPGTFTATTDASGGFALRLSADERLSALGGERDFAVDAAVPGGGGVRAVFPVDSALVDVPDLSVWDAAAAVSADSAAQRVTWAALPAPVASQIEYAVTFTDAGRGCGSPARAPVSRPPSTRGCSRTAPASLSSRRRDIDAGSRRRPVVGSRALCLCRLGRGATEPRRRVHSLGRDAVGRWRGRVLAHRRDLRRQLPG